MKKEEQSIGLVKKARQPAADPLHRSFLGLPIRTPLSVVAVAVVSMGLYACGGDGDGDGSAPPPPPVEPSRTLVQVTVEKAPESVLAKAAKSLARATSLPIGFTQQYVATGLYSDRSTADVTATTAWSSSDEAVATVVAGAATAQLQGETFISACQEEVCSAPVSLAVDDSVVTKLTITAPKHEIFGGSALQFEAKVLLSDQRELNITDDPALSWKSSQSKFFDDKEFFVKPLGGEIAPGRFFALTNPLYGAEDVTVSAAIVYPYGDFNSEFDVSIKRLETNHFVYTRYIENFVNLNTDGLCPPDTRLPTLMELAVKRAEHTFPSNVCDGFSWPLKDQCSGHADEYLSADKHSFIPVPLFLNMRNGLVRNYLDAADKAFPGHMYCITTKL